jgi:hypothetical protein
MGAACRSTCCCSASRRPMPARSYADVPVVKSKKIHRGALAVRRARLHALERQSALRPEELEGLEQKRSSSCSASTRWQVYDFEHDVKIAEHVDAHGWLPSTFMLLQPQSWHEDVWTDITRMRTLNGAQSRQGREMHLCPMQFDLADRVIEQFSMRARRARSVRRPHDGALTRDSSGAPRRRHRTRDELLPRRRAYCKAAEREMRARPIAIVRRASRT